MPHSSLGCACLRYERYRDQPSLCEDRDVIVKATTMWPYFPCSLPIKVMFKNWNTKVFCWLFIVAQTFLVSRLNKSWAPNQDLLSNSNLTRPRASIPYVFTITPDYMGFFNSIMHLTSVGPHIVKELKKKVQRETNWISALKRKRKGN